MLNKFSCIILMFSLIFLSSAATGQGMRPGKWWKDPKVSQKLELTDKQIHQLDEAYNKSRRKMIRQKSDVEQERFELQTLFESKKIDEDAIQKQHRKVEKAKNELSKERLKFIVEVRKIIGSEKYSQLKLIFQDTFRSRSGYHKDRGEPK